MKIKGFLVDVGDSPKAGIVEVEQNSLQELYKILDCDCIDITVRSINGIEFDIVCDDNGLLVEDPIPSAIGMDGSFKLVGNLFICHHDSEGNLISISDEEVKIIESRMGVSMIGDFTRPMLVIDR